MEDRTKEEAPVPLPASGILPASPETVSEFRERLTKGKDVVDPKTWAGAISLHYGVDEFEQDLRTLAALDR